MGGSESRPEIASTEDQDELFAKHFSSKESQSQFKIRKMTETEIANLVSARNQECTNRTTLGGWNIGEFDRDSIYFYQDPTNSKFYCFTRLDKSLLDGVNPYTGRPFDGDVTSRIFEMQISAPLSFYSRRMCPVFENTPKVVFVTESERHGGYYLVSRGASYSAMKVYRGTLKTPRLANEVLFRPARFEELRLVYDGSSSEPRTRTIKKAMGTGLIIVGTKPLDFDVALLQPSDLFLELQAYMSNPGLALSTGSVLTLKSQRIRLEIPIVLYRGFSFDSRRWLVGVDDEIELDDLTDASSWTTNVCIAEFFAGGGSPGVAGKERVGYVVRYEAAPDEVVIDTRLLKEDVLDQLTQTGADQAEVLLDKRKRMVTIVAILINGDYVKAIKKK